MNKCIEKKIKSLKSQIQTFLKTYAVTKLKIPIFLSKLFGILSTYDCLC